MAPDRKRSVGAGWGPWARLALALACVAASRASVASGQTVRSYDMMATGTFFSVGDERPVLRHSIPVVNRLNQALISARVGEHLVILRFETMVALAERLPLVVTREEDDLCLWAAWNPFCGSNRDREVQHPWLPGMRVPHEWLRGGGDLFQIAAVSNDGTLLLVSHSGDAGRIVEPDGRFIPIHHVPRHARPPADWEERFTLTLDRRVIGLGRRGALTILRPGASSAVTVPGIAETEIPWRACEDGSQHIYVTILREPPDEVRLAELNGSTLVEVWAGRAFPLGVSCLRTGGAVVVPTSGQELVIVFGRAVRVVPIEPPLRSPTGIVPSRSDQFLWHSGEGAFDLLDLRAAIGRVPRAPAP